MDDVHGVREASEAALDSAPVDSNWGSYVHGDALAAIGGGMSAFYGFESREKMLAFIAEHALFMNLPRPTASSM